MLIVKNLSKRFGSLLAVDDVSFSAYVGEVVGFLGPNGAGKSTTMKMITGFLSPSAGTALIKGLDIEEDPLRVKKLIGYLPEGTPIYSEMTVLQFLLFVSELRGFSGKIRYEKVAKVVQQFYLEEVLSQQIDTLSKGFKCRLGLAQALIHDPELLILDEPTDGLDPNQKHEIRNLIKDMAKEKAIVLSTHILEEVEAVCDRAIIITNGKIITDSTPKKLAMRSKYYNTVSLRLLPSRYLDVDSAMEELQEIEGIKEIEIINNSANEIYLRIYPITEQNPIFEINRLIYRRDWQLIDLCIDKGHLDEVFRNITNA